jgi:hypothetical protein
MEGIPAVVILPFAPSSVKAWTLDNTGSRSREIAIANEGGSAKLSLLPQYQTIWYEIAIK